MTAARGARTALCAAAIAALGAACASASTATGDTGNSGGGAANPAFLASVTKVCERAVEVHAGHKFPFTAFDPEHPDRAKLPAVGDYFARYGQLPATATALHRLKPPAADAQAWNALLSLVDNMVSNARQQIGAARARDTVTFVRTVHTANRLTTRINTAGTRFGFTHKSACGQVFG